MVGSLFTEMRGVFVANLTPFHSDGSVNVEAYLDHVAWLSEKGVKGLVPLGTNGEGPSLSLREKLLLLERLFARGLPLQVVPAAMEGSLPATLEMIRAVNDLPAAGILVLPPYYYKPVTVEGLRRFFEAVLEVSRHPVVLYHVPKYAVPVPPELVKLPGVWGVKDSGEDTGYTEAVLAFGKGVWVGTEDKIWERIQNTQGVVSALANFAPEALVRLWWLKEEGRTEEGQKLARLLEEVRARVKAAGTPFALKRLAEARHQIPMGGVRPPLVEGDQAPLEVLTLLEEVIP